MNRPIRSIITLSILAVVLAACGTTAGASATPQPSPSQPVVPSVEPSAAPSEEPAPEEREVVGTITIAEMAFSGPGESIEAAIADGDSGELPDLVNGVLFLDTDGTIYLATAVTDPATPTFEAPMLEVLNMANDGSEWDMANAELLSLEEANGIIFRQPGPVLGFIDVP